MAEIFDQSAIEASFEAERGNRLTAFDNEQTEFLRRNTFTDQPRRGYPDVEQAKILELTTRLENEMEKPGRTEVSGPVRIIKRALVDEKRKQRSRYSDTPDYVNLSVENAKRRIEGQSTDEMCYAGITPEKVFAYFQDVCGIADELSKVNNDNNARIRLSNLLNGKALAFNEEQLARPYKGELVQAGFLDETSCVSWGGSNSLPREINPFSAQKIGSPHEIEGQGVPVCSSGNVELFSFYGIWQINVRKVIEEADRKYLDSLAVSVARNTNGRTEEVYRPVTYPGRSRA